jgi:large subunit ribosomal protein L11
MAKEIDGYIKLQIPAGQANPAPPVGPAIGQRGLNIMEFCKAFNTKTQKEKPGMPIPCIVTVYKDKTFQIKVKKSPASHFLKEAANLTKASRNPGREIICQIPMSTIKEIAEKKMDDLNAHDINQAAKIIAGTARSMGYKVVEKGKLSVDEKIKKETLIKPTPTEDKTDEKSSEEKTTESSDKSKEQKDNG